MKAADHYSDLKKALPNVEFAVDQSRIYDDFVRDLSLRDDIEVEHPQEYSGQEAIKLVCSQHRMYESVTEYLSADDPKEFERRQRRYTAEWVRFLRNEKLPVREVHVCSSVNQKVFGALCSQTSIESLRIKRLMCRKIDGIENLSSLRKLFIESGSSIEDISPIAKLPGLEVLILGQTKKVHDYSPLAALKRLKVLGICMYRSSVSGNIKADDMSFLKDLPALEYADIADVRPSTR
ncbi:MAG: hypothetical protein J6P98_06600 [Clostridia bacterium]|nr:hypothetical protein [Clostridia bacterium]